MAGRANGGHGKCARESGHCQANRYRSTFSREISCDNRGFVENTVVVAVIHTCVLVSALRSNLGAIHPVFASGLAPTYEPLGHGQGYWWDWVLARILLREAEALIGK